MMHAEPTLADTQKLEINNKVIQQRVLPFDAIEIARPLLPFLIDFLNRAALSLSALELSRNAARAAEFPDANLFQASFA